MFKKKSRHEEFQTGRLGAKTSPFMTRPCLSKTAPDGNLKTLKLPGKL